ncbi:MAG: hypothetical protein ACLT98_17765 [Eggerthellaceae bacterium]
MKNLRVYFRISSLTTSIVTRLRRRHRYHGYSEHFDTYAKCSKGSSLDAETGNALLDDAEILLQSRFDIWCFPQRGARSSPYAGKNLVHRVSFLNRAGG